MLNTKKLSVLIALLFLAVPVGVLADDISPTTAELNFFTNPLINIHKTVTISKGVPTSAKADIFFLADTTGSMGGAIAGVKAGAASILTTSAAFGDIQWGVGEYRDAGDAFAYRLNQNITGSQAAVTAGINAWTASGGGDTPEANLYALQQASLAAYRPGSQRFLVQFGDAPGHDPSVGGVTEADATAAMLAQNIKLLAIDVGNKDATGQETRMTAATGGQLFAGVNSADIAAAIEAALEVGFSTYTNVNLDVSEAIAAGINALVFPIGGYTGDFTREEDRTFEFDVIFSACCLAKPGLDTFFDIFATVDGGRVASERDHATCVPIPGALLLLGSGLGVLGFLRRNRVNV